MTRYKVIGILNSIVGGIGVIVCIAWLIDSTRFNPLLVFDNYPLLEYIFIALLVLNLFSAYQMLHGTKEMKQHYLNLGIITFLLTLFSLCSLIVLNISVCTFGVGLFKTISPIVGLNPKDFSSQTCLQRALGL